MEQSVDPGIWLSYYPDNAEDCLHRVLMDPNCRSDQFKWNSGGDKNCGCWARRAEVGWGDLTATQWSSSTVKSYRVMRDTCYSRENDFFMTNKEYDYSANTYSTRNSVINLMPYQHIPVLSSRDSAYELRLQKDCNLIVKKFEPDSGLETGSNDVGPNGVWKMDEQSGFGGTCHESCWKHIKLHANGNLLFSPPTPKALLFVSTVIVVF